MTVGQSPFNAAMRGMLVLSSFPSGSFGSLGQDSFVFGDPPVVYTISALRIWGGTQMACFSTSAPILARTDSMG